MVADGSKSVTLLLLSTRLACGVASLLTEPHEFDRRSGLMKTLSRRDQNLLRSTVFMILPIMILLKLN